MADDQPTRICRDEDCPKCGRHETYAELQDHDLSRLAAIGCSKCGWRRTPARQCFYVPHDQFDENGYIPSLVTENEPGHAPLTGNGRFAEPWYWGKTYEEAQKTCDRENARLGLSRLDAADIVASSMGASR